MDLSEDTFLTKVCKLLTVIHIVRLYSKQLKQTQSATSSSVQQIVYNPVKSDPILYKSVIVVLTQPMQRSSHVTSGR
jgi:hypothetical protein